MFKNNLNFKSGKFYVDSNVVANNFDHLDLLTSTLRRYKQGLVYQQNVELLLLLCFYSPFFGSSPLFQFLDPIQSR
jgi:hypothetical protein